LQIYKLLPKTNCKDCGFPTCLAFAMKLAAKQVDLDACAHVSAEAKEALSAAAAPPIRLVKVGTGDREFQVGNETVMFRHEKTFFNKPGLALRIKDTEDAETIAQKAQMAGDYSVERVGITMTFNAIALENASGDPAKFAEAVKLVRNKTGLPFILAAGPDAIKAALPSEGGHKPLLYAATAENWQAMAAVAKESGASLAVRSSDGLNELADLTTKIEEAGVSDLVLDPGSRSLGKSLAQVTQLRRLALKQNYRPLGFPIITFPGEVANSEEGEIVAATQYIAKYAGVVVMDHFDPAVAYPLLTLRLNIFTDPQKPISVDPGIYEFNSPTADSPLLTTTNFSLTYFSVAGELDGSGMPAWLLICDAEGMSVLTAWAAGKFDAETIAKAVKNFDAGSKISHKKIALPGHVAVLSGELEEELPGWEIRVGPREAVDIPSYLRSWK
ncbi:MAG TPA: acetyl-CoA decarbonylase/synthase complex subunit gamma, partial [Anaerolineae bacterium]|nr:acetyl-CoA decarbonylase/synthase complex subunit gamma [Anaerolineae bacterium]